jgi:hypothetical protein
MTSHQDSSKSTTFLTRRHLVIGAAIATLTVTAGARYLAGQSRPPQPAASASTTASSSSFERVLRWPLPATEQAYGAINGDHVKTYIDEIVALTRKNRAPGAQYWGRITGTPVDGQMREWVMGKFRQIGLQNVREVPFDLAEAQYNPKSWSVTAMAGATKVPLTSVYPFRKAASTPRGGVDLQPVWVGLGTPSDFAGRNVQGKAAVIYAQPLPSTHNDTNDEFGSVKRAREAGAAAILLVYGIPGNFQHVSYGEENLPYFSVGMEDGLALRELMEKERDVKVHIELDAEMVPGRKSATVWGELPGSSDEIIMIAAHRDGFFEGAGDNASGVAVMLGLAEHFAKVPQAQRRRTIRFMAATGHHHIGPNDTVRLNNDQELMSKLVVALNAEHAGWTETYTYGMSNRKANGVTPLRWYVRGSDRLRGIMFSAFDTFGVKTLQEPGPGGAGDVGRLDKIPIVSVIESPIFFHSNFDLPEYVPASNLEAVTRAFAKIVDEVNKVNRNELQGPLATESTDAVWDRRPAH